MSRSVFLTGERWALNHFCCCCRLKSLRFIGNLAASMRRWRLTSAATVSSVADQRSANWVCWRGNAAGLGGWTFVTRISLTTLQATGMGFFGLYGSTAALATTLTLAAAINCIGIGFQRGTHSNWRWSATTAPARQLDRLGHEFRHRLRRGADPVHRAPPPEWQFCLGAAGRRSLRRHRRSHRLRLRRALSGNGLLKPAESAVGRPRLLIRSMSSSAPAFWQCPKDIATPNPRGRPYLQPLCPDQVAGRQAPRL